MIPSKPGLPLVPATCCGQGEGVGHNLTARLHHRGNEAMLDTPWDSFFSTPEPGSSGFKCFPRAVYPATYPDDIFEKHIFTLHARFLVWPVLGCPLNGSMESVSGHFRQVPVWHQLHRPQCRVLHPHPPWHASHENRSGIYGKSWVGLFSPGR